MQGGESSEMISLTDPTKLYSRYLAYGSRDDLAFGGLLRSFKMTLSPNLDHAEYSIFVRLTPITRSGEFKDWKKMKIHPIHLKGSLQVVCDGAQHKLMDRGSRIGTLKIVSVDTGDYWVALTLHYREECQDLCIFGITDNMNNRTTCGKVIYLLDILYMLADVPLHFNTVLQYILKGDYGFAIVMCSGMVVSYKRATTSFKRYGKNKGTVGLETFKFMIAKNIGHQCGGLTAFRLAYSTHQVLASSFIVPYSLIVKGPLSELTLGCIGIGIAAMLLSLLSNARTLGDLSDPEAEDSLFEMKPAIMKAPGEKIRKMFNTIETLTLTTTTAVFAATISGEFEDQQMLRWSALMLYSLFVCLVVVMLTKFQLKALPALATIVLNRAALCRAYRPWHLKRLSKAPTWHCLRLVTTTVWLAANFIFIDTFVPHARTYHAKLLFTDGWNTKLRTVVMMITLTAVVLYYTLSIGVLLIAQATPIFPGLSFGSEVQWPLHCKVATSHPIPGDVKDVGEQAATMHEPEEDEDEEDEDEDQKTAWGD